jgi:hypothetical protein
MNFIFSHYIFTLANCKNNIVMDVEIFKLFVHIARYMCSTIAVRKPQSRRVKPTQLGAAGHHTTKLFPTRQ